MRVTAVIVLCLVVLMIIGCAAFQRTISDIKEDPAAFKAEAGEITAAIDTVSPVHTGLGGVAAGYLIAFLRKMYVNKKKEEATKLAKVK